MSHQIDHRIIGDDLQIVEIDLDPGEAVIAEAGAMNYLEDGIRWEAVMGDGSRPHRDFWDAALTVGKRVLTGESLFLTRFENAASARRTAAFAAPYPGKIVPMDLGSLGEILCQRDTFLCAAMGTKIDVAFTKNIAAGLFGGEGLFVAELSGAGTVWLQSLPFARLARRVLRQVHRPGRGADERSILGGLGSILMGDR